MTNLERLKLELAHKDYFTDTEFRVFLEENGLDADYTYNKAENQLELLQTVLAIFQALINNIEAIHEDSDRIYNGIFCI